LVVVGTIAILAALLLPGLSQAKASAKSAACKSNLHQLGVALKLYVDDYRAYPLWAYSNSPRVNYRPDLTWEGFLLPYANGSSNIFVDPIGHGDDGYGYNSVGMDATDGPWPLTKSTLGLGQLGPWNVAVPESRVIEPADMIAVAHGDFFYYRQGFGWPGSFCPRNSNYRRDWLHPLDIDLFCDTHVESSNPDDIPTWTNSNQTVEFKPDANYAKRWNNDNQPHPETWPKLPP
jgi:type II secretory pathway pseudopilin PulG